MGGWVCLGFPRFWENAGTPPLKEGGRGLFLVGGLVAELGRPPMLFMGRGTL